MDVLPEPQPEPEVVAVCEAGDVGRAMVGELLEGAASRWVSRGSRVAQLWLTLTLRAAIPVAAVRQAEVQTAVGTTVEALIVRLEVVDVVQRLAHRVAQDTAREALDDLSREVFDLLFAEVAGEEARELAMTEPLTEEDREAAALLELLDSSETRMAESAAERAAVAEEVATAAAAAERKRVEEAARQSRLAAERRKKDAATVRAAAIEKSRAEERAAERAKTERIEAAKRAKASQAEVDAKARQAAADAAKAEEMKAKADALKNSKLGMGVGFGTGVDFNKRLRGRAGRAKAVVAADNQLEEMKQTRRQLRRTRKTWGKSIFEAEQARRRGEQESDALLYNISRIGRLRAHQEEQLLKLAELTAVQNPDLLLAAIEAVEEKDAEACMNAVGTGVGMAERERMGKYFARQQAAQKEKEREHVAEKWRQHIMAADAGVSYEELMYAAEKREQQTKELLSAIKRQVGAKMRNNKEATGTLEGTFRAIDVDGGGSIDYVEFGEFLGQLGATVTGEELELLTQMLDKDSDGTIDYDEFVAWFRGGENGSTYAEQVADIFREYAPQRLGEVGSLLARYEYNEDTLLAALRKQYKVAEAERAKRDAARVQGNSDETPPRSRPSSSGSLRSTGLGNGSGAARPHPRTALEPLDAAPSTPAALALDMADSYGGQLTLYQQQEGEWQQSSLGVSLIAKMTSPTRLGVSAAAALVAQEAEEEIASRFDLTVWQTEEGVVVSDAGLQDIKDALDQGQAAARAAAARKRAFAEATAGYIIGVIEDQVQGELAYKEERRLWEEKQARLAAEAAFNAKMAALQRQKELFCPSPRTARQRKFAERYRHLRGEGASAYVDGAFAAGLVGAKSKGVSIARDHAKSAAIRHMLNRPLVRVFNAWRDWARTNVGARSWGALQTATKWKFDKVGTMLDGTMDLLESERARQAMVDKAGADRKERRSLRGMSKRAEAAYEKQMAKVKKLDTMLRQKVPWGEQEPPEFGRRRHIRKY